MSGRRIETTKRGRPSKAEWNAARYVMGYVWSYRLSFVTGLILLGISASMFLVVLKLAGEMAQAAEGNEHILTKFIPQASVETYIYVFAGLLIFQAVVSYTRIYLFTKVGEYGIADLRRDLFQRIIALDVSFIERNRTGDLISRLTADIEQLQSTFSNTLPELIRQIILFIGGLIIIFIEAPKLSLFMLSIIPVVVLVAMALGMYVKRFSSKRQESLARTNVIAEEAFSQYTTVKAFVNERFEMQRYRLAINDMISIAMKYGKVRAVFVVFIIFFMFGSLMTVLWRGALMVKYDGLSVSDLTLFILLTGVIGGAIASFGNYYVVLLGTFGATKRVQEILSQDTEINIDADLPPPMKFEQSIAFQNVSFSYPTRQDIPALNNISLQIDKGDHVAIVGASGAGKSTIVKLLAGFYPDYNGEITIDGASIRDYPVESIRQNIAIVPQDVVLFGGSIQDNIAYGCPNASEKEIVEAAQKANVMEFVESLPNRLNTTVGERGVQLSGGQKQRVAIARAILKDPKILVLDEATSSLDSTSESLVQDALERLMQNRTTIVIAHRLSTVRNATKIIVQHHGKIEEIGNHDSLLAKKGRYHFMVELQQRQMA
ncbi:MAG: multidrug ABC transporter ATP-binding protein [Saprospirales bacterium]|nr:multidrug ABC transporter ATP-binding protein [Saprospirales bacterium]